MERNPFVELSDDTTITYVVARKAHNSSFLLDYYYICPGRAVNPAKHRVSGLGFTDRTGQIQFIKARKR